MDCVYQIPKSGSASLLVEEFSDFVIKYLYTLTKTKTHISEELAEQTPIKKVTGANLVRLA